MTFSEWESSSPDARVQALLRDVRSRHGATLSERPAFASRLTSGLPDVWAAYSEVYGDGRAQADALLDVLDVLVEAHQSRSAELQALDERRLETPGWFHRPSTVGMMIYTDHFAGTLPGMEARLPYLEELGITYVHLMPLLETRDGPDDGGYAVKDYRAVNPSLGSIDDLRHLASALHDRDMVLAADFVMNHTAREHDWARRAVAGDPHYQALYRTFPTREEPDAYEAALPEVFPDFAPGNFTYVPEMDRWVWTTFYDFQWDLNYANPDVFQHVLEEMLFLVNVGVDVLRLDAVPFLWKEKGTNCQNRPEAHALLQAFRGLVRAVAPGVLFKAEAIVAPTEVVRYLGAESERDECDTAYNAALMCHLWHALASQNVQLLRTMLAGLPDAPGHTVWLNYVRAHDDIGWGIDDRDAARVGQDGSATRRFCADYYAGRRAESDAEGYDFQRDPVTGEARTSGTTAALVGLQRAMVEGTTDDVDRAVRRMLLLHSVTFVMRGFPQLYSGDEIGQLNDYSYLNTPDRAPDNRWLHRPRLDWDKAALRHDPDRVEHALFYGLKKLIDTRCGLPALHAEAPEQVLALSNDRVFAVERRPDAAPSLLALANFSGHAEAVRTSELPSRWHTEAYRDALTEQVLRGTDGVLYLPPYAFVWLQPAPEAPTPDPVSTTVRVEVTTEWGEEVFLTGAHPAFGADDLTQTVGPLSAKEYPTWTWHGTLPDGVWTTVRWVKERDGDVLEISDTVFAVCGGRDKAWRVRGAS